MHLAGNEPITQHRSQVAASAVTEVLEKSVSLFPEDGVWGELKTGLFLLKIGFHESRFDAKAKNGAGDCGVGQVATATALHFGSSCEKMQASMVEGFQVSLWTLQAAKLSCGKSMLAIACAYASGQCNGAQKVAQELIP